MANPRREQIAPTQIALKSKRSLFFRYDRYKNGSNARLAREVNSRAIHGVPITIDQISTMSNKHATTIKRAREAEVG